MKNILLASLLFALGAFGATAQNNNTNNSTIKTIYLTKADFLKKVANYETNPTEWKYLGDKPCIIDFYASWCGPCKMIAPILEELAEEYDGKIYIYKVNTEKERDLAADFGISSIPTLLFCPIGENPQMARGALPKETFKQAIEDILLKETITTPTPQEAEEPKEPKKRFWKKIFRKKTAEISAVFLICKSVNLVNL